MQMNREEIILKALQNCASKSGSILLRDLKDAAERIDGALADNLIMDDGFEATETQQMLKATRYDGFQNEETAEAWGVLGKIPSLNISSADDIKKMLIQRYLGNGTFDHPEGICEKLTALAISRINFTQLAERYKAEFDKDGE